MTPEERDAWLAVLKSGDVVALECRRRRKPPTYSIVTVVLSLTDCYVVGKDGDEWNHREVLPLSGEVRGGGWTRRIVPATREIHRTINLARLRAGLRRVAWEKVPDEVVEQVADLLTKMTP